MAEPASDTRGRRRRLLGGAAAAVCVIVTLAALLSGLVGASTPSSRRTSTTVARTVFGCPTKGRSLGPAPAAPDLRHQRRVADDLARRRWPIFRVRWLQPTHLGVVALVTGDLARARRVLRAHGVRDVGGWDPSVASVGEDGRGQVDELLTRLIRPTFRQVGKERQGIPGYQEIASWQAAGAVLLQWKAPVPAAVTRLAGTRRNGVRVIVVPTRFSARELQDATTKVLHALSDGEVDATFEFSQSCGDGSGVVVGILPASLGHRRAELQRQLTAVAGVPVRVVPGEVTPASLHAPASAPARPRSAPRPQLVVRASSTVAYVVSGTTATTTAGRRLFRSTDRGRTFARVSAPAARDRQGHQLPLTQLVFVDARDGYALLGGGDYGVGTTTVVSTSDGGRTWRRDLVGDHVVAVAGHGHQVFAATVTCARNDRCGRVSLFRAAAGSSSWRREDPALPTRSNADGVGLAAFGSSVWLMLGMGESPAPVTVRSTDSGATFTAIRSVNGIACTPVATSSRVIWTTCSSGMMLDFYREVATGPVRTLPVSGSGTGSTFLDPVSDTTAYSGTALGNHAGLHLTRDGGRTFHRTRGSFPPQKDHAGWPDSTTFFDARTGLAVVDGGGLYRTSDAGGGWQFVRLAAAG